MGRQPVDEQSFHNTPEERKQLKRLVKAGVDITRPLEEQSAEAQAAYARFELEEEAKKQQGIAPIVRVRVKARMHALDEAWMSLELRVQLGPGRRWLWLTPELRPLWVARRYTGQDNSGEAPELYVISAIKQLLQAGGVQVLTLSKTDSLAEATFFQWDYTILLGSRLTVAMQAKEDGSVVLLGLA